MSWVVLDDQFHSHPKVLAAGNAAIGLYARALSYCGAHLTDGFIPAPWLKQAGNSKLIEKLVLHTLLEPCEGGWKVRDYLEYNPPRDYVLAKRSELSEKRAKAGKLGARKRWQTGSKDHGKPDSKLMASGMANGIANAKQNDGPTPIPTPTPLTESSTVSNTPTHPVVPETGGWENEQEEQDHELVPANLLHDMPEDIPF